MRTSELNPVTSTRPWETGSLKACLFDFGGTLDADGIPWQDNFYGIYLKNGVRPDREAFRQAFYFADDTLTETRALQGAGFRKTVEEQVCRVWDCLGIKGQQERMHAIIEDFITATEQTIERNRSLLQALHEQYALGIVSNFYGNMEKVCEDLRILDLFSCIVDSTCVGVMKPDSRIFDAALGSMQVEPNQAVYVGDNPYRDMQGAKGVGMPHIWLAGDRSEKERIPCCPGDPVICSLSELEALLLDGRERRAS